MTSFPLDLGHAAMQQTCPELWALAAASPFVLVSREATAVAERLEHRRPFNPVRLDRQITGGTLSWHLLPGRTGHTYRPQEARDARRKSARALRRAGTPHSRTSTGPFDCPCVQQSKMRAR